MKKLLFGLAIAGLFAACKGGSATVSVSNADSVSAKIEKNKQTALASEQAINAKDVAGVMKYCAPDFIDYGNGQRPPEKNIDSIKAGLKSFFEAFPDMKGENLKALADSNTVAVIGDWSGTFSKDMMGIKATNKAFKLADVDIFTFNEKGQISSHRSVQTEASFFEALGISMPAKK